ncbi:MAG: hypothetical protein ACUVTU_01275 [Desulfurispora sp.]|uniref:hypothetical protein n=1 Tax=Desulfurispora sp. TaxID=3014275 RepID=UPI004048F710
MLEVYVSSSFSSCPPEKRGRQIIPEWQPAPAKQLIKFLGINDREIGLITADGRKISLEDIITPPARVEIWPHFWGG